MLTMHNNHTIKLVKMQNVIIYAKILLTKYENITIICLQDMKIKERK